MWLLDAINISFRSRLLTTHRIRLTQQEPTEEQAEWACEASVVTSNGCILSVRSAVQTKTNGGTAKSKKTLTRHLLHSSDVSSRKPQLPLVTITDPSRRYLFYITRCHAMSSFRRLIVLLFIIISFLYWIS